MSRVTKLLHTRYRVNDLERTVKFYRDVLGLEEIKRHKSPRGSELVFLKTPGSEELVEITCFPGSGPVQVQPDLTHLAFEVDNLEAFAQHLSKHGLKFSDGPTTSSSVLALERSRSTGIAGLCLFIRPDSQRFWPSAQTSKVIVALLAPSAPTQHWNRR